MLPMLIKRCLAYGIQIIPIQLKYIVLQYEKYQIPDDVLSMMNRNYLESYVKALYLSGQSEARDWSLAHEMLIDLGFERVERKEGHRCFVSLVWVGDTKE